MVPKSAQPSRATNLEELELILIALPRKLAPESFWRADASRNGDRPFGAILLGNAVSRLFTQESRRHGLAFQPRPNDVVISPYAKCGTTWLQHIAHGLRTRGSMNFDEITTVTPWLEIAKSLRYAVCHFRRIQLQSEEG